MMHTNFIVLTAAMLLTLLAYFFLAVVVVVVGIGEKAGTPRLYPPFSLFPEL
jgi:hypothetical protein